jgi:hypothetical protein
MKDVTGFGGVNQELIKQLNDIYFPNGMPFIPEDKQKEIIEHIEKKIEEILKAWENK